MEQSFHAKAGLAAVAWVKGLFRNKEGNIPPQAIVDLVAPGLASPSVLEAIAQWNEITKQRLNGSW